MEIIDNLILGLSVAATPYNLFYCFVGALVGTLIGVLPGLGPLATIAMLLPLTFGLDPVAAMIMLAGIYYGAQYGGSTTAILINLPGEASSVITALDGYQLARKGKAGLALASAAIASFIAGTIATFLIVLFAPPLSAVALMFGPPEYFSLMVLGLIGSVALARGSFVKALAMIVLGLLLGLVGTDVLTGNLRFTLNFVQLADGVNFVIVAMALFGIADIIRNLELDHDRSVISSKIKGLMPKWHEIKATIAPSLRGTAVGSVLGILPGGGAVLASFASYTIEKQISSNPEEFGQGATAGVAGPEAANNAGAQTSFIPMLTLGIPSNPVMAMMVGGLIIQGIQPGPQVMTEQPELFWGLIASMWIGNLFLVLLNLPLIQIWVRLLTVPYDILYPIILVFCTIGVFTISNATFDVYLLVVFAMFGYLLLKLECEPAPLIFGFILGPMMEENLRRAMLLSRGDPSVLVTRPISAVLLAVSALLVILVLLPKFRKTREEAFKED